MIFPRWDLTNYSLNFSSFYSQRFWTRFCSRQKRDRIFVSIQIFCAGTILRLAPKIKLVVSSDQRKLISARILICFLEVEEEMRSLTKESNDNSLDQNSSSNFSLPSVTMSLAWFDNLCGITPTTRRDRGHLFVILFILYFSGGVRTSTWPACCWS